MATSLIGDLVNPAERLAREEYERAEKRRQELAEQRSDLNPPDVRIRTWERIHALRLPSDPAHPILDVIAISTRLTLEEVREEQRTRAARAGEEHGLHRCSRSLRPESRERPMKFAPSTATRQRRMDQLRRDRATA